ncbi:transporter [Mergibacter septicus]|uniref:Transporter n=2 Tax=Mergibacter septicus TaxID=221402 RepID=A0A8D4IYZ1_9PAST|nr:DASS family sodium-coupled anion symporter [Mergibacter septicus]AWX16059.1 transporter [Mergibacter septicus]QDJ15312.1 transporter [Mergibacter septicus]UTU48820.1 DASS family sodium-coupled anion symporter [Mergibacter septicus]WMR95550.1 DASS family sodium-coupled anion symporter [Mergibacter septicus]
MHTTAQNRASLLHRKNLIVMIAIILFFILLQVLPFSEKENKGLALLVFVGILWLTEALHVTVTALIIPILVVLLGLSNTKTALATFSHPIIFLFFGGFALATALHIQKLDRLIANKIMSMANGNLFRAVLYLFGITAFLSMWMSNTATTAMMLPLAMGILSHMDREKEHNTYVFVLLGIAYSASIGGMGTPVGSPPNAIVVSQLNLTFYEWMQYGIPTLLLLLPFMVATLYIVFKPKFNQNFKRNFEQIELTSDRKVTLFIFTITVICWILSGYINPLLSATLGIQGQIASLDSIIAVTAALILCISRVVEWKQIQDNTNWGVLILFGGGITLSSVLSSSGASKIMADAIVFMIRDGHFYLIGLVVATFVIFLTEFTSNTATTALLVPIFISIAQALGLPPLGLSLIIGLGASCAFMLPVATPPNAIVFGTGQIKQQEMIRIGIILNIISIFLITTIGYIFWFK